MPHLSVGEVQDLHMLTATVGGAIDGDLFSAVVIEDTLEFVLHPAAVLRRVWQHLKPGGFLFVVLPYIDVPDTTCVRRCVARPFNAYAMLQCTVCCVCKTLT